MSYGSFYSPRSVEAYRASPMLHRHDSSSSGTGGGGGRGGRAFTSSGRGSDAQLGPDIYGFSYADGLPGFEGSVAAATLAPAHSSAAAPEAGYLALLCHEGLADFRQAHTWDPSVLPAVETALRTMAQQSTPSAREMHTRLQAMAQLKELAQSGVRFCHGLDLEPYGSFVSGLYTPTGDLDLSIEGQATWYDEAGRVQRVTVDDMDRTMRVKFLRALANRIDAKRLSWGQIERILHARVPILKFRSISGLDFDVGIGGSHALFKSTVVGLLAQYEWRFGALVRLVKLWARHYDVNDSANGTLNSFALTLLVVFHLQTRSPPVLPPLCELFGQGPDSPRPMQEGQFPDWALLTTACDTLSQLSERGGLGPDGSSNSETLLELLSSFFALYEGLLHSGWAQTKGADAGAMRGVLRRVRVDTWGGRLRYARWDKDGYCCSVEDPFDSTDNCARTVRSEDKVAVVAGAVATGRELLLELESPHQAERALQELFGPSALHPRMLHDIMASSGRTPAVAWIRPVDLIIPPRIQAHTDGRIPLTVHVSHQRQRGVDERSDGLDALQRQLDSLTLAAAQQGAQQGQQQAQAGGIAPPPGLEPAIPVAGRGPTAAIPGNAARPQMLLSLQQLRRAMAPEVDAEAARLAELERKAAEAAAQQAAAREERKAAKKAAAKALQKIKAEERRRARAERGRSRSGSRGARSRSGSRARATSPAVSAALEAAEAAVSNLGQGGVSFLDIGSRDSATVVHNSKSVAATAVADARQGLVEAAPAAPAHAAESALPTAAELAAQLLPRVVAEPARVLSVLRAATDASNPVSPAVSAAGDVGDRCKDKRFGKNMKAAHKQRRERRAASASGSAGEPAAGAAPAVLATQKQQQPLREPRDAVVGAAAAQQQQQQQQQQRQQQPEAGGEGQQRSHERDRGRGQQRRRGSAAVAALPAGNPPAPGRVTVLQVRRVKSGTPAPPPPPPPPLA